MKVYILLFFISVALLVLTVNAKRSSSSRGRKTTSTRTNKGNNKRINVRRVVKKTVQQKLSGDKRGTPFKKKKVGGSSIGFFKKGGGFNMGRKNGAVAFKIFKVEELLNNTKEPKMYNIEEIEFDFTKEMNDSSYGVPAQVTTLSANLKNSANISVSMITFRDDGKVTTDDGYEFNVTEGTLKFNLDFDWPNEMKYVDVVMGIKCFDVDQRVKGKKQKKHKGKPGNAGTKGNKPPVSFGFCESVRVTFSSVYGARNKSENSTQWRDMPEGFPSGSISKGAGWSKIKLRFQDQNVVYDPVMEVGDDIEVDVDIDSGSVVTTGTFGLSVFSLLFVTNIIKYLS